MHTQLNPMATCLKTGANLGGLNNAFNSLEQLFGTVLVKGAAFMAVALFVVAIFMVLSRRGSDFLRLAVIVALIPFGAVLVLTIAHTLFTAVAHSNGC